jgi:energy-coupling factor transporter ATP-binding protein EcfA2
MELLMINYLAQGRGVIIHCCGIEKDGEGILFIGESGAGKSTMANLWNADGGIEILSDDRVIVRKSGEDFRMYGTPWHGEAQFVSPRGVKLKKMFFLRHAGQNEVHPLSGAESVQQLLKCSFPPFWDATGMNFTLDLFTDLATVVPCYGLGFKPDRSAIDYIYDSKIE